MNRLPTITALSLACTLLAACASRPPAANTSFRDNFTVNKSQLAATGKGRYWDLTPGHSVVYRSAGDEKLTITNLAETKVVDGVTTRVVEEREEKGGKPTEISRNFMAIDPATGDIYYFGEESQTFKNGKPSDMKGSWIAGEKGARFGMLVPGTAHAGDRFYQELAPGVAMDRFEVVGADEKITVAAGTFEHCLHVIETTPLENDTTHKWYAPGVGLVKDDEFELASVPEK